MEPFSNRPDRRPRGPVSPRGSDPLDQRLDRWMTAGRQLVDGVSGARPGGRTGARNRDGRPSARPSLEGLGRWVEDRLDWLLEDEDDWREPWQQERIPTPDRGGLSADLRSRSRQDPGFRSAGVTPAAPDRSPASFSPASGTARQRTEPLRSSANPRRALEALSRREPRQRPSPPDEWPAPEDFQVNRWQRSPETERSPEAQRSASAQPPREQVAFERRVSAEDASPSVEPGRGGRRPLPRSSRRRD